LSNKVYDLNTLTPLLDFKNKNKASLAAIFDKSLKGTLTSDDLILSTQTVTPPKDFTPVMVVS
jgi:hypothetical protein